MYSRIQSAVKAEMKAMDDEEKKKNEPPKPPEPVKSKEPCVPGLTALTKNQPSRFE